MRERLQTALDDAVTQLLSEAGDYKAPPLLALEASRQAEHGDFATNAPLVLAKRLRKPPRAVADLLIARIGTAGGLVARAEVAGPGFVNFWLEHARWNGTVLERPEDGRA